jgi:hypothetical protein
MFFKRQFLHIVSVLTCIYPFHIWGFFNQNSASSPDSVLTVVLLTLGDLLCEFNAR